MDALPQHGTIFFSRMRLRRGKADLHIHSNFSDGHATVAEILDHVEENTDLTVIAITDHNTIDGALLASEIVRRGKYRFDVVIGEEISSKHGDVIGLFLQEAVLPYQSFEATVQEICRQGGLAIIPHPNLISCHIHPRRIFALLENNKDFIAGIELSSGILYDKKTTKYWLEVTRKYGLAAIGATDSHELFSLGRAVTYFTGQKAQDLYQALTQGKTEAGFTPLTLREKLRFFTGAAKWHFATRLKAESRSMMQHVPKFSPTRLALRSAKHYLGLPY